MAEPAELLLIKDQYERALDCLNRALAANDAGRRSEALEYLRMSRQHLTQGLGVPTGGERHEGEYWSAARQLQLKMRETFRIVATHHADTERRLATESQSGQVLMDLPPRHFYPTLVNSPPVNGSVQHLYPNLTAATAQSMAPHLYGLPSGDLQALSLPSLPPRPMRPIAIPAEQPPAYTPQPTEGHQSLSYGHGGGGLGSWQPTGATPTGNADELLFIPSGVQMFFVAPDGQVSALSCPGYLRIIRFESRHKDASREKPSVFLHTCDWLYPLTEDTPVLLANSGIFMFPDIMAETPGSFVGIVLSSELPRDDTDMFHDLLSQLTELRVQAPEEGAGSEFNLSEKVPLSAPAEEKVLGVVVGPDDKLPLPEWSEKMAHGILTGATWLSKGFVKGAEATEKAIHRGAAKLRDHITPEETPSEVKPQVTKGLQVAKQATGGAVKVTQFLVNGVCYVAGCVGDKLAPHVKKHGAKLIPESMKKSKDGHASTMDGAMMVAASSIQGFSTIWSGLETGAKCVGKSVKSETVTTVNYKYGDKAGQATDTGLSSAVNVGVAAYNIDHLGLKGIMKAAGKKTAKAVVRDHQEENGRPMETDEDKENQNGQEEKLVDI